MSSERQVRILPVENPRFPEEGSSAQGKSGPKPRSRDVGDGQLVEIPVPPDYDTDAMTRKDRESRVMVNPVQARRQARSEVRVLMLVRDVERRIVAKFLNSSRREKLLKCKRVPVPQTDTGG